MSQKDQMIMILDTLKKTESIPYVVKVGLYVNDMAQFKDLNAEYVKYFGLKPPVRVCVQVPGNEIIAYFMKWKNTEQFSEVQNNIHVQSISEWAPPNVGPYSQSNKMYNLMYFAGSIGLYPPLLQHISADILLQYKQTKHNFNQIVREATTNPNCVFQNVAKSVIVFISDNADVAAVLLDLQKDLAFLKHASVVVRVPVLPLNSLIEMELMAENNEMAYKSLGC